MTGPLRRPEAVRASFDRPRRRIFRLETLQVYEAPDEAAQLAAFQAGRPRPPDPGKDEWTAVVRASTAAGTCFQRVHVVREPLSLYLRYELTWSYAASAAAGEDIRILPLPLGQPWPAGLPELDFWLFDEAELLVMRYDAAGRWLGVEAVTEPAALATAAGWREAALAQAVPWSQYVTGRSELAPHLARQAS